MPGTKVFNNDKNTGSDHCTVDEPCGLGDGDCDPNDHATCRGFLKCKANVGSHFGFANNNVDVCVHPDFYWTDARPRPVPYGDGTRAKSPP
ncbi:hypothetical protein WME99_47800 [Sorangium sp. So ce136]|uniref:hypothetical protein n=1 Tax=Sorangium sp. So ce136 TaxID=3133284 RepID=UPI003F03E582